MNDNPSSATRRDQAARKARRDLAPQAIEHIQALAVLLRQARNMMNNLMEVAGDIWPVAPDYGADSLTGEELRNDLFAWDYFVRRAEETLDSHFTNDVSAALKAAGLEGDDEDDEDDDQDEDDDGDPVGPDALVAVGGDKPYWRS